MLKLKYKLTSNESGSRDYKAKATVETILKQLEYVTKGHMAKQTILF